MPAHTTAEYLVYREGHRAAVRIVGKAMYLNCNPVGRFFRSCLEHGVRDLVVDFQDCTGLDSTFMGMLASTALRLRKLQPPGELSLARLAPHNRSLVLNLGIGHLVTLDPATGDGGVAVGAALGSPWGEPPLAERPQESLPTAPVPADAILEAHQSLVDANESNRAKFQDVLAYLRKEADKQTP